MKKNLVQRYFVKWFLLKFCVDYYTLTYSHEWELTMLVGSCGNSSLRIVMKVMV